MGEDKGVLNHGAAAAGGGSQAGLHDGMPCRETVVSSVDRACCWLFGGRAL